MNQVTTVNIRPGVTILSVLKHLNYKPYYALAEFVDNSLDSFIKHQEDIKDVHGSSFKLSVDIEFDNINNKITIRDNAAGIHTKDIQRAFRAAEVPPDNSKLSEFGMGMKSAACWFANKWQVRTTALGENIERTVNFDITKIVNDKIEELDIELNPTKSDSHYTVITLFDVQEKMPIKRGLNKVKRHLTSIYRDFIRNQVLELKINNELQVFKELKILRAPFHETPGGEPILWKQHVDFDFGRDLRIYGFVALMETMTVSESGFALFRRGRVIEGSADRDEGFRPQQLFGSVGSHRYKRLFGELHLEGFKVSHTKDGFQWDDNLDTVLDLLKEELEHENSIPILKQADKYRSREKVSNYQSVSKRVVESTANSIKEALSSDIDNIRFKPIKEEPSLPLKESPKSYFKKLHLNLNDVNWTVHIELSYDDSVDDLIQVGDHLIPNLYNTNHRSIGLRLSLVHPFMVQFAGSDSTIIEPILRIVAALGLSEVVARETKSPLAEIRNNMNELLKNSLSKIN